MPPSEVSSVQMRKIINDYQEAFALLAQIIACLSDGVTSHFEWQGCPRCPQGTLSIMMLKLTLGESSLSIPVMEHHLCMDLPDTWEKLLEYSQPDLEPIKSWIRNNQP